MARQVKSLDHERYLGFPRNVALTAYTKSFVFSERCKYPDPVISVETIVVEFEDLDNKPAVFASVSRFLELL